MNDTIHIAFGFDQNYAMPCGVAMTSVCENTPGPICFHALIADDVSDETRRKIESVALSHGNRVFFYVIDQAALSGVPDPVCFSKSAYNRLLIPDLLPQDVTKVIYLDSDIVVLRSLRPMWDIELKEDEPAAMAVDCGCSNVKFHNRIGIPLSQPYCNSGVILMNLSCWRSEQIGQKCINRQKECNYPLVDQDPMNCVIGSRVKNLHLRFNLQVFFLLRPEDEWLLDKSRFFSQVYEAKEAPVIIHFADGLKPWHEGCPHAEEWLKYKSMSPWRDVPLSRRIAHGQHVLYLDRMKVLDPLEAETYIQPLFALVLRLEQKHHRAFVLLRKLLWTIARKNALLEEEVQK